MTGKGIKGLFAHGALATAIGVIGTTATTPANAEVTFSAGDFNVAFDHIGFDTLARPTTGANPLNNSPIGAIPSISGTPFPAIEDSAFYSARALVVRPAVPDQELFPVILPGVISPGDPEPRVVSSWLHGFDSRWLIEHKLSDLDPVTHGRSSDWRDLQAHGDSLSGNDARAARLFSNFETTQHQAKSLVWDTGPSLDTQLANGRYYAAVNQGAFADGFIPEPLALNKIFVYDFNLAGSGSFPDPGGLTSSGSSYTDINVGADFAGFIPEGLASIRDGADATLFVSNRDTVSPSIAAYDTSTPPTGGTVPGPAPGVAAALFGGDGILDITPAAGGTSLRGMTASAATGVYVADLTGNRIIRIPDPSTALTEGDAEIMDLTGIFPGATPHHMTLGTVGGEEVLFITNRGGGPGGDDATTPSILYVDTDDYLDSSAWKEIIPTITYSSFDDGVITGDLATVFPTAYGFGGIAALEGNANTIDLLLTLEDAIEYNNLGPSTLDIFRDQILRVTLDLTFQGAVVNGNAETPEPATLAILGLGGLAMTRRRRKA